MSADPLGGSRWTISFPESSRCWMISRRSAIGLSLLLDAAKDGLAVVEAGVEQVDLRDHGLDGGGATLGARGGNRSGDGVDAFDQRDVEVVHAGQRGLIDLQDREQR